MDYSKLPRSSGDGMEFSSSNSGNDSLSEDSEENDLTQKANNSLSYSTVKRKSGRNVIDNGSAKITTGTTIQANISAIKYRNENEILEREEMRTLSGHTALAESPQSQTLGKDVISKTEGAQLNEDVRFQSVQRQNSTNLLLQGPELLRLNNELGLSLSANDQLVSLAPPAMDLSLGGGLLKSTIVEQRAEFVDSQKVISDLQEQNAKLVEEKTKLSVQLGVQTKVCKEPIFQFSWTHVKIFGLSTPEQRFFSKLYKKNDGRKCLIYLIILVFLFFFQFPIGNTKIFRIRTYEKKKKKKAE